MFINVPVIPCPLVGSVHTYSCTTLVRNPSIPHYIIRNTPYAAIATGVYSAPASSVTVPTPKCTPCVYPACPAECGATAIIYATRSCTVVINGFALHTRTRAHTHARTYTHIVYISTINLYRIMTR